MFLFCLLTSAKQNCWPKKLKIVEFIWIVKNVRHLIKSFKYKVIIQTNYLIIISIVKQCSIVFTISIIRINLKLVWALQYLCQFNLNICYKLDKDNIVLDILFWPMSANTRKLLPTHNKLNILFAININFLVTIV